LLVHDLIQNGRDPVLKQTVVVVRNEQIADSVDALVAQLGAGELEVALDSRRQTLDEVLFHAAGRRHQAVDHLVLAQVADVFAHAARHHVGGVAEEDGAVGFAQATLLFVGHLLQLALNLVSWQKVVSICLGAFFLPML